VWIDHVDPTGRPPGDAWRQCSLGAQCSASKSGVGHLNKVCCVEVFEVGCPGCWGERLVCPREGSCPPEVDGTRDTDTTRFGRRPRDFGSPS
jgi:hypothetical protein